MGRNASIKRYETQPEGQPMDLFAAAEGGRGRVPVVLEILKSPWVMRASEMIARPGDDAAKRREIEVTVEWDGSRRCPAGFDWRGKRYRVDALVHRWTVERSWWDASRRVSRRCFRVIARGGVYDLAFCRLTERWLLVGVQD